MIPKVANKIDGLVYYDKYVASVFQNKGERHIYCGTAALWKHGLTTTSTPVVDCWTDVKLDEPVDMFIVTYYYNELLDSVGEDDCTEFIFGNALLLPSKERAILEYIHHIDYFLEEYLIEALDSYKGLYDGYDKLYELAGKYGVTDSELGKWIKEAEAPNWY